MKKVLIEVDIPEYEWVECPTAFETPIGVFYEQRHVDCVQDMIEYLQGLPEIEFVINANHQHIREPLCREIIRNKLWFVKPDQIGWLGEKLSHFLHGFRKVSGRKFSKYIFTSTTLSNGKKIQFKTFTMLFDDEESAVRHIVRLCTNKDFTFEVLA